MRRFLWFAIPFIIWLACLWPFLNGTIPLNMDTNTIYAVAKYYFNNVLNGTVPLWEPFVVLGRPFYALPICNLFHPTTQVMPPLVLFGINYQIAFIVAMIVYFALGLWGFYLLVKQLLNCRYMAYIAYVALLFSSVGVGMFTQWTLVEILVPAIWFFYGVLAFAQKPSAYSWGIICLSLMTALVAYLPFYFLTVVIVVGAFTLILFFKETISFIKTSWQWARKHKAIVVLGVIGILVCTLPLLIYKNIDASGDVVAPGRHCQYVTAQECYDRTMGHQGGMLYEEITRSGTLAERLNISYLFSHQDKLTYGSDSLFFVPIILFLWLATGFFLPMTRLSWVLVLASAMLVLIGVGDVTGVYRALYEHLFFMKYFRNIFFFQTYLIPLGILLALMVLKQWLSIEMATTSKRKIMTLWVILVHASVWMFLNHQGDVLPAAYATVIASVLVLMLLIWRGKKYSPSVWAAVFAGCVLIHPIQVMAFYTKNAVEFSSPLPHEPSRAIFSWVRPEKPEVSTSKIYQFVPYEDFWYGMAMKDSPARISTPQSAGRWIFQLAMTMPADSLAKYATAKIVLYDQWQNTPDLILPNGQALTGPNALLEITRFNVNELDMRTHFSFEKLVVYNDAYTRYWHVYIDGKEAKLLRANVAFKAVVVPGGEHDVSWRYQPPGGGWVYIFVTLVFMFLSTCVVAIYFKERRQS